MPIAPFVQPRQGPSTAFLAQATGAALVTLGWLAFLLLHQRTPAGELVSNMGLMSAAGVAAASCALTAFRTAGPSRRAWLLFAASCASWGAGQAIWTWYETVLGREVPFPSAADLGYLGAVPLAVAALLAIPSAAQSRAGRTRMVVDGLVTASSLMAVSWVLVLGPMFEGDRPPLFQQAIGLAYPLGDVVMITMAVAFISRRRRTVGIPVCALALVCAALTALAVADSGFTYLTTAGVYSSGNAIDAGWFTGFALLFLASRCRKLSPDVTAEEALSRRAAAAAPYVAVLAALVAAGACQVFRRSVEGFVVWDLVVTMVLLVARQYLAILENHALARTLEERVRERTEEVRKNEERFRSLVQNSSDVVTILDPDGTIRYQSASVERVYGYESDLLVGTAFDSLVRPDDAHALAEALEDVQRRPGGSALVKLALLHRDGQWCHSETAITNLLDHSVRGIVLNTRDISERKRLEEQLRHQAFHDPLTGLANAALFRDRIGHALAHRTTRRRTVAVLFCDLDGFKRVNDSLGHASGDELLRAVGRRLVSLVRPADTVARLGGDEFAVLLEEVMFAAEANVVAERLADALREPIVIDGRDLFLSFSVGIAVADSETDTVDALLRNADLAMYRAKAEGLGSYKRYEPAMRSEVVDQTGLESDLHHALARGELSLRYQPIVDLETGRLVGAEALARWNHPVRGLVPPAEFIPLAEWSSLIVDLGRWVLHEACSKAKRWAELWPDDPPAVSVNLSGRQLLHPGLPNDVSVALELTGLDPGRLVLEMTESVLLEHNDETVGTLQRLKELGVRLAIDDFGTGYSSLSYLHRFPFDVLKIDRSFVERLSYESRERSLASGIVRMGRGLDLVTVAEGIEGEEQLRALRSLGCDLGQGWYFSPALSAPELEEFAYRCRAGAAMPGIGESLRLRPLPAIRPRTPAAPRGAGAG
ncbi:MAG TPA: EAL domain-containing protein [Acidimicrobiales bacterium]|nr:EAL domain-containing protein [Acidimicrobiales bacterium]